MTTQFATASYQEVIDLHTETNRVSILGIHTPSADAPYTMLQGFFDTFQKYHYDGCSLALVPAARLPADPSQVSYESGSIPIDPRDLLNPILWHGCHGESLGSVLNQFYASGGGSTDVQRRLSESVDENRVSTSMIGNDAVIESLYYRALTDNSWRKAHPQAGLRVKGLRPLVYSVSTTGQYTAGSLGSYAPSSSRMVLSPDGASVGNPSQQSWSAENSGHMGQSSSTALGAALTEGLQQSIGSGSNVQARIPNGRNNAFLTHKLEGLGWLDTRVRISPNSIDGQMVGTPAFDNATLADMYNTAEQGQKIVYLPRLFMGICLLPPAYKAEQYFRLVINHRFSFKKFRGMSMRGDKVGRFTAASTPSYCNML